MGLLNSLLAATSPWLPTVLIFTFTFLAIIIHAYYVLGKKWRPLQSRVRELEASLKVSLDKCAAERQGRIRAQQGAGVNFHFSGWPCEKVNKVAIFVDLRKALLQKKADNLETTYYPMMPIGNVQSCFSTRNGTPRQPLLVPLARACLVFDPMRVPPASLEGLEEYSHVWIIYVFHLNTDLDKLWLEPSRSKIKAKVRVPRLKGGKKGVYATRSPHRPCPIGLTVAKVEAVQGHMILLSGVDLVDGTPVLDVKPYLPYCDSIQKSVVPEWVKDDSLLTVASVTFSEGFHSALADCWELVEKCSLYSSPNEMKKLIEQVLSWDIRSSAQRHRPNAVGNSELADLSLNGEDFEGDEAAVDPVRESSDSSLVVYHLILEGLDISYVIDDKGNVCVESVASVTSVLRNNQIRSNYSIWKDKLE